MASKSEDIESTTIAKTAADAEKITNVASAHEGRFGKNLLNKNMREGSEEVEKSAKMAIHAKTGKNFEFLCIFRYL